jgi:predicted transcriptional regulator
MMGVLMDSTELSVTSLAMISRMNHKRCNAMIRWLHDSGHVRIKVAKKNRSVILTQNGREYARRLLEVKNMTNSPAASCAELHAQDLNALYYRSIGAAG